MVSAHANNTKPLAVELGAEGIEQYGSSTASTAKHTKVATEI